MANMCRKAHNRRQNVDVRWEGGCHIAATKPSPHFDVTMNIVYEYWITYAQ
jgi:hypothetical protein